VFFSNFYSFYVLNIGNCNRDDWDVCSSGFFVFLFFVWGFELSWNVRLMLFRKTYKVDYKTTQIYSALCSCSCFFLAYVLTRKISIWDRKIFLGIMDHNIGILGSGINVTGSYFGITIGYHVTTVKITLTKSLIIEVNCIRSRYVGSVFIVNHVSTTYSFSNQAFGDNPPSLGWKMSPSQ